MTTQATLQSERNQERQDGLARILAAMDSGETVWYVTAYSSAAVGAPTCHVIGRGWVTGKSPIDAKRTANRDGDGTGRKLFGDFGFGAGHVKKASRETRESVLRAFAQQH